MLKFVRAELPQVKEEVDLFRAKNPGLCRSLKNEVKLNAQNKGVDKWSIEELATDVGMLKKYIEMLFEADKNNFALIEAYLVYEVLSEIIEEKQTEPKYPTAWKSCQNGMYWQVWRQTEKLWDGEPMNSRVRECKGCFDTRAEAEQYADELNSKGDDDEI